MNRLLDSRLAELTRDFPRPDGTDGLQSARRIPEKLGSAQKVRKGKQSTMAKLNRDIRAIIEQPLITELAEPGDRVEKEKEDEHSTPVNELAEICNIRIPARIPVELSDGRKGIGLWSKETKPAGQETGTPSPATSLLVPKAEESTRSRDGVTPLEQSIREIDKDIGEEVLQGMVLSA